MKDRGTEKQEEVSTEQHSVDQQAPPPPPLPRLHAASVLTAGLVQRTEFSLARQLFPKHLISIKVGGYEWSPPDQTLYYEFKCFFFEGIGT